MTLPEAITIIENYQAWRLGAETEMIDPKVITQAIDVILNEVKKQDLTSDEVTIQAIP